MISVDAAAKSSPAIPVEYPDSPPDSSAMASGGSINGARSTAHSLRLLSKTVSKNSIPGVSKKI
jgi:hypothetical protein